MARAIEVALDGSGYLQTDSHIPPCRLPPTGVDNWRSRTRREAAEDVDGLLDVALEMDPEDGCLTVYDGGTTAFTRFGIENLKELIEIHKANPSIIEGYRKLG
jgi:hypothetical protein